MRGYIEHLKETKTPHERRQHAMRVAGVVTGALFAVWIGTLSMRLTDQAAVAESPDSSLTAAAVQTQQQSGPRLEVSTTSVYSQ